jgi:hypothetical protein
MWPFCGGSRICRSGYGKVVSPLLQITVVIAGTLSLFIISTRAASASDLPPDTAESREADELFKELLQDPMNVELTFRYAEAAIKAGNIEAGISSLERLLLLDRNFPGVKLELAELYARLHSYAMAKSYLAQAEQEPGLDENAQARIQALRNELGIAISPSKLTTDVFVGVRHQSDASAEPAGSDIVAGGVPETLTTIFLGKPAWDVFASGNVQHTYNFGGFKLESNLLSYYSVSIGHSELDVGAVEFSTGPRFDLDLGTVHLASTHAYVLADEVGVGNSQFLKSVGTGLSFDRPIFDRLSGSGFYEFRTEWFSPVTLAPDANLMNGNVNSFGVGLSYQVVDHGNLGLQVSYALTNGFTDIGSNKGLVIHLGYSQLFPLPKRLGVGPLELSSAIYRIYSKDDVPNPLVDPDLIAATDEWRFVAAAKLGLTDHIAANLSLVREVMTSNVPANRANNTQIILGAILAY